MRASIQRDMEKAFEEKLLNTKKQWEAEQAEREKQGRLRSEKEQKLETSSEALDQLRTVEARLNELRAQAQAAQQAYRADAETREREMKKEMEELRSRLDSTEARARKDQLSLEQAKQALQEEQKRRLTQETANPQGISVGEKEEWADRERELRHEVERLSSRLLSEEEESNKLKKGHQQLRERAKAMYASFKEREALMRLGYEEMKERVKGKVKAREGELLAEIDALKGHLKEALDNQQRSQADLEASRRALGEMERQHTREELEWLNLKRELTQEETERREASNRRVIVFVLDWDSDTFLFFSLTLHQKLNLTVRLCFTSIMTSSA